MESGLLDLDAYKTLLSRGPKLVSFTHMSNVLGTINPAAEIIRLAHAAGALTLVVAAQSVPHLTVDVKALDADFLAFSAHKMCGPTGIGILYGRKELLDAMPPFLGGGDMIKRVHLRSFSSNELPARRILERKGPAVATGLDAEGKPTKALEGFMRSAGVTFEQLQRSSDGKTEYFAARVEQRGKGLEDCLSGIVAQALKKLPITKLMRWGDSEHQFVRPVHALTMLHGEKIVPGEVLGLQSGNVTPRPSLHVG